MEDRSGVGGLVPWNIWIGVGDVDWCWYYGVLPTVVELTNVWLAHRQGVPGECAVWQFIRMCRGHASRSASVGWCWYSGL